MVKQYRLSNHFVLNCSQDGSSYRTWVVQSSLPWEPIIEDLTAYTKEEGNKNFIYLKHKYSAALFCQ